MSQLEMDLDFGQDDKTTPVRDSNLIILALFPA